jgi:hypothetical protein
MKHLSKKKEFVFTCLMSPKIWKEGGKLMFFVLESFIIFSTILLRKLI